MYSLSTRTNLKKKGCPGSGRVWGSVNEEIDMKLDLGFQPREYEAILIRRRRSTATSRFSFVYIQTTSRLYCIFSVT